MSRTLIARFRPASLRRTLERRWEARTADPEAGMSTAEYAVGTLAACAFAAVLLAVVKSGAISAALTKLITSALAIGN